MKEFQDTCRKLLSIAEQQRMRDDRTNTGTFGYFGEQWRFNLLEGLPLVTTKFTPIGAIIKELLWILSGSTNNNDLVAQNVHIWDEWAAENGDLGPVYGKQWRNWMGRPTSVTGDAVTGQVSVQFEQIDQITQLIEGLKAKPFSRRHIVTAWQPSDILPETQSKSPQENVAQGKMALAPCHCFFQFYVSEMTVEERCQHVRLNRERYSQSDLNNLSFLQSADLYTANTQMALDEIGAPARKLSCQLYQRSADFCLGVPFNTASYSIFTMMVAQCVGMAPGDFIHTFGDLHMYSNHVEGAREWVQREPFAKPILRIDPTVTDLFAFKPEHFKLEGYQHHPKINFDVAV